MARPNQGDPPPWGNDLNAWLDVGHNTDGTTKPSPVEEWGSWGGNVVSCPDTIPNFMTWDFFNGGSAGAGALIDLTDPTHPAVTEEGWYSFSAWVGRQNSGTPLLANGYMEIYFLDTPDTLSSLADLGTDFPLDGGRPTSGGFGSGTLAIPPVYVPVGTALVATIKHHYGSNLNFQLANGIVTKYGGS